MHGRRSPAPDSSTDSGGEDYAARMTMVSVHEAVPQLARLVDRAHAGEEIVIAKAGVRCVRLVPIDTPPPRELGRHRDRDGVVPDSFVQPLDDAEVAGWDGGG